METIIDVGPKLQTRQADGYGESEYPHPNAVFRVEKNPDQYVPDLTYENSDVIKLTKTPIQIGDKDGVQLSAETINGELLFNNHYYIVHKDSADTFYLFKPEEKTTFLQILSTFQFTN